MEFEVKSEINNEVLLCRTCLNGEQKLKPLGQLSAIFRKLFSDCEGLFDLEMIEICLECEAMLKRIDDFYIRVQRAIGLLLSGTKFKSSSLSSPETTKQCVQTECVEIKSEFNKEASVVLDAEEIENKKQRMKKQSNWARRRALLNKKPKYVIIKLQENTMFKKKRFNNVDELNSFLNTHRCSDLFKGKEFKCESCVYFFKNNRLLESHNKRYHNKRLSYICDICESNFPDKLRLKMHIASHFDVYECQYCGQICQGDSSKGRHVREHGAVLQCLKCDAKFSERRDFYAHHRRLHESFVCHHCGVSFKMRYCIKDHLRRRHAPKKCTCCNKTFARYKSLWMHTRLSHASAVPAYCVECDKHFTDVYKYRRHLNGPKHKPGKKRRIPCPNCGKVFSKNIYMKNHYDLVHLKKIHNRCEECDKNYLRKADLLKHKLRIHEGVSPPRNKICGVCSRGFTVSYFRHVLDCSTGTQSRMNCFILSILSAGHHNFLQGQGTVLEANTSVLQDTD
ncbi:zinc finger and BTB domain-containing protein 17-like isoform X1 [Bombyx mandarina]|uniref:Zinc finger and BTB domain-containing protein 17-like isoform X1 n=1 Tax=Bombyx mandarina TaxID=7092 RepID=A0A6J2K0U7_BOMMA|nr:zinc finger and BTB domain-containing protein 17-like isoform X1 [Bombyx mandarina]